MFLTKTTKAFFIFNPFLFNINNLTNIPLFFKLTFIATLSPATALAFIASPALTFIMLYKLNNLILFNMLKTPQTPQMP